MEHEPLVRATISQLVRARASDPNPAVRFEGRTWSWSEVVQQAAQRAALLSGYRPRDGAPFHVGVLLENTAEFWFMLCGAALCGATIVGINPTRRGQELARDITHTDCAFLVTETAGLSLLDAAATVLERVRTYTVDDESWSRALLPFEGATLPDDDVTPADTFMLIFTSGTTGAPKAVRMSQGKLAQWGTRLATMFALSPDDVCYSVMPLFHSNAAVAGFTNVLVSGASVALRRRFSASGFLPDVREHGVTFFNYVGKPLTYILATPEQPDDSDNTLRIAFGNEAAPLDVERFAGRFGCTVVDGYGSTEGGISIGRTPDAPPGSLGRPAPPVRAEIRDPDSGNQCPPAEFDEHGRFLNAEHAIGEIVNPDGPGAFEGYYNNPEADAERVRDGVYWSGDLGYRDADGFFYFAGRSGDWLRVDGENFAAAPVEAILARHPDVVLAAVYAVPSSDVGDEVMVALHLRDDVTFDPAGFASFLVDQPDLSPKWTPRFVRVSTGLPSTATQKVLKRVLRSEHWECSDAMWWRPGRDAEFRVFGPADARALRARFESRGRAHLLGRQDGGAAR